MAVRLEVPVHPCSRRAAQLQTTDRTEEPKHSLQGAGHAVLRTLYSRAHRIGLDGTSCLLRGLCKSLSLDLFPAVVVSVLACPALELVVLPEQELERLADYVGRVRINEFRVPIQVVSDFLLQANLKGCRLRLL